MTSEKELDDICHEITLLITAHIHGKIMTSSFRNCTPNELREEIIEAFIRYNGYEVVVKKQATQAGGNNEVR